MKIKSLLVALLCAAVIGCATPYRPHNGFTGYYEVQLAENTFMVSFVGNELTNIDTSINYALLRSAQLTIEKGYNFFAITGSNSSQNTSTGYVSTGLVTVPYTSVSPSTKNIIVMFKQKPESGVAYHAPTVFKNLTKEIGL